MEQGFMVMIQQSHQPLKDILLPVKRRNGYLEGVTPIVPVYFYRYVGMSGKENLEQDSYYNDLYALNEQLSKHPSGYLKIEGPIPMPTNEEIQSVIEKIKRGRPKTTKTLKDMIVSQIIESEILNMFPAQAFQLNSRDAFDKVMELYMNNEQNVNESKAENFSLKLIVWLKRYQRFLFKETQPSDIPKVLFYGDIKSHEVYFLTLLALIGCDVLFVHTDKSKMQPFLEVDKEEIFSKLFELPESVPLEPFPITERAIRKSTVAYKASQEIQNVLYGEDVGLFKARQYEEGITKAVTLRTTYDELKILWHEEAKFRPEFEVKGEKVYVPNLFAKVNGTPENLSEYWKDIHELAEEPYTIVFKRLPILTVPYTKQEMFASAFLFNQDGLVDKEALMKSPLYKFHYLKPSLQEFILYKINELLCSNMFHKEIDEKMKLKILMTVITMDTSFLRLIESFDYTGKVPKILIYSHQKDSFSEEEMILLSFFHVVGADILIFTPTNYVNIEQWIRPEYFDIHQLPSVQFDMEFQMKPLMGASKGIKKWFLHFFQKKGV